MDNGKKGIHRPEINKKPFLTKYEDISQLSPDDIKALVQELRIHQVELEAQVEELKITQEQLQESRDKYQELYNTVPVAYLTINKKYSILEANATAAKLFSIHPSLLLKSSFTHLVAHTQESQDAFYLNIREIIKTRSAREFDLEMQRSDGGRFLAHLLSVPLNTGSDSDNHIQIAVIDITSRQKAEKALAKANDELEIKVRERTEQLQESYDETIQSRAALEEANKQLKEYSYRITQIQEEERKKIAYELHDDTAQYLAILKLQLDSLIHSGKIQDAEVLKKLDYLEKDAARAVDDVRRYSHELRPGVLEHLGLQAALEQIAEDQNKLGQFRVEVNVDGAEPEISEDIKLGFFRIAQEAINNCRKHAKAQQSTINLRFEEGFLKMAVSDNGIGFDVRESAARSTMKGSLGLMSMQERANLIGADLKIDSTPSKGTTITAEMALPIDPQKARRINYTLDEKYIERGFCLVSCGNDALELKLGGRIIFAFKIDSDLSNDFINQFCENILKK